jgi:hypothetical protein
MHRLLEHLDVTLLVNDLLGTIFAAGVVYQLWRGRDYRWIMNVLVLMVVLMACFLLVTLVDFYRAVDWDRGLFTLPVIRGLIFRMPITVTLAWMIWRIYAYRKRQT